MRQLLLAATAAASLVSGVAVAQTNVPLIPREVLFGNPVKANARISPDGKWLSWTAPVDGVLNIWVAPSSNPAAAKAVTAEKNRPIRNYFWAPEQQLGAVRQRQGRRRGLPALCGEPDRG